MRDLREFLDEGLDLPIGGVTYRVPPPSAAKGLVLQRLADIMDIKINGGDISDTSLTELKLDDQQEIDFYRNNLGAAYDEMVAGGVTLGEIKIAAGTAFFHWTASREVAEAFWESQGPRPPAKAPTDHQAKKASPKKKGRRTTGTGGASSTRSRSSGSGTSPQLKATPAA